MSCCHRDVFVNMVEKDQSMFTCCQLHFQSWKAACIMSKVFVLTYQLGVRRLVLLAQVNTFALRSSEFGLSVNFISMVR